MAISGKYGSDYFVLPTRHGLGLLLCHCESADTVLQATLTRSSGDFFLCVWLMSLWASMDNFLSGALTPYSSRFNTLQYERKLKSANTDTQYVSGCYLMQSPLYTLSSFDASHRAGWRYQYQRSSDLQLMLTAWMLGRAAARTRRFWQPLQRKMIVQQGSACGKCAIAVENRLIEDDMATRMPESGALCWPITLTARNAWEEWIHLIKVCHDSVNKYKSTVRNYSKSRVVSLSLLILILRNTRNATKRPGSSFLGLSGIDFNFVTRLRLDGRILYRTTTTEIAPVDNVSNSDPVLISECLSISILLQQVSIVLDMASMLWTGTRSCHCISKTCLSSLTVAFQALRTTIHERRGFSGAHTRHGMGYLGTSRSFGCTVQCNTACRGTARTVQWHTCRFTLSTLQYTCWQTVRLKQISLLSVVGDLDIHRKVCTASKEAKLGFKTSTDSLRLQPSTRRCDGDVKQFAVQMKEDAHERIQLTRIEELHILLVVEGWDVCRGEQEREVSTSGLLFLTCIRHRLGWRTRVTNRSRLTTP